VAVVGKIGHKQKINKYMHGEKNTQNNTQNNKKHRTHTIDSKT
jgi:hypothetical protein